MADVIKGLVKRVNETLRYYEKEYIELKRTPDSDREVCQSFEQYVEIRFNMESCRVPELLDLEKLTGGHLFNCTSIKNQDSVRRRFSSATIELIGPDDFDNPNDFIREELEKIKKFLGGSKISFNSVKCRIKIQIDD
jgi:hypothetical protein